MARTKKTKPASCKWKLDDIYGAYDTECGEAFLITEGTPPENNMLFCPYCGGTLKVSR